MIRNISLDQFFQDLRLVPEMPFAWVLGAGAAVTSQVPTGRTLALRWMKELFEVRHPNAGAGDYATWDAAGELRLAGLDPAEPAPFYGELYKLRFGHHPKLGQEFLRSQLLGRTPSYGYSALAQIQTESEHKYAVTTNFDHLLEEAYRRYLNRELIVCASDDQAKTLQRLPKDPLLAKIHGDIFHETKNDANYIAALRPLWHDPLRTLFNRCTPLFIGYGGNDPGFMGFLTEIDPSWFPDRPVWTYHEKSGVPKGDYLDRLSQRHDILLVPIPGFDEFLFLFSQALDLKPLTKRLEADFASRVQAYQNGYEAMAASLREARPKEAHAGGALDRALATPDQRDWREWRDAARNAPTYEEGRHVLEQGLKALPQSPELRSSYARYRVEGNPNDPEAEAIARNALAEAERQYGPDHPGTISCLAELAKLLYLKGDWASAEPLLRRALETRERVLGPEHPDTLTSVNNLANLLYQKRDWAGVEPLYRRALETRERVLGPEHPDTLTSVSNLALLLYQKGDLAGAEPLYRRALETRERVLGPEHPETLANINNLAGLLYQKGDLAGAEPLYRRTLEARERVLGPEHPETLTSVNNLALVLYQKGDLAGAEPLSRRALETRERVLGPEHPDMLTSVNDLANVLYLKRDLAGAEPLYRRALETEERVLGPEHPDTLTTVNNLANLLYLKRDLAGAELLYRRALETRTRVLGPQHPDTVTSANGLKSLLDHNKKNQTSGASS